MSAYTLDITCSCGATLRYLGTYPSDLRDARDAFLTAHEPCRRAGVAQARELDLVEGRAVQRSLLKVKRRNGGRPLGLS